MNEYYVIYCPADNTFWAQYTGIFGRYLFATKYLTEDEAKVQLEISSIAKPSSIIKIYSIH